MPVMNLRTVAVMILCHIQHVLETKVLFADCSYRQSACAAFMNI